MTIEILEKILRSSYSRDTTHPNYQKDWALDNPTAGHCAIVAMIVQDYFGGEIWKIKHQHHYYNVINENIVDLTAKQFGSIMPIYSDGIKTNRPKGQDCIRRYQLLNIKCKLT